MFSPSETETIKLSEIQKQLAQCISVCEQIAKLPNKSDDDLKVNDLYLTQLRTAQEGLGKLALRVSCDDENSNTFTLRG